jgi:hypothetical protein
MYVHTEKYPNRTKKKNVHERGIQNDNHQIFQLLKNNPEILFELFNKEQPNNLAMHRELKKGGNKDKAFRCNTHLPFLAHLRSHASWGVYRGVYISPNLLRRKIKPAAEKKEDVC